ncbi:EamA-like transporter family protein [Albidovulum inexpectatum]|uniref:EamA-like transporter family protein n=1 Tax=Albidovulum inexpectatum TaxID=196587 RepID=A0A2S5JL65_9RHOB|nr:DMT family transporter [Albidovulum inexpectatum]PPB82229.1 EamA-like transporter family protein [Albidovulum inexpectatum]
MRLFWLTAFTMVPLAANSVLNRMAIGAGLSDPVGFAMIRLVSGAVVLAVLLFAARIRGRLPAAGPVGRRTVGVLSLLVYMFGFSLAYLGLDAGVGALILFGMVQVTMFLGAALRREPLPASCWIGAAIAFAGLAWLLVPGSAAPVSPAHAAMMALGGMGWGVYSLAARGAGNAVADTAWNFILSVPVAMPVLLLALVAGVLPEITVTEGGIALAVVSGAITSGLAYALWYRLLPELGAARAGVAQLTVPVLAMAGGMIFLEETLTLRFALSSLLVLGGVAMASLGGAQRTIVSNGS